MKTDATRFAYRLDVTVRERENSRMTLRRFWYGNWEEGGASATHCYVTNYPKS